MCRCLSMQNSQRALGGTAHASDQTSHRVRPWVLTLSNCVKPYLASYRVVSHHQLPCPVFCFPEQAPRAQARVTWRRTGRPAPRRISSEARGECGGLGGGGWGQNLQSGPEQAFQGLPPPKHPPIHR